MTHEERARHIIVGLQLEPAPELIRALSKEFEVVDALAREEKNLAWVDTIAGHGGYADDVFYLRCLPHRAVPQFNRNEAGKGECGACIAEGLTAERDAWKQSYEDACAIADRISGDVAAAEAEIARLQRELGVPQP